MLPNERSVTKAGISSITPSEVSFIGSEPDYAAAEARKSAAASVAGTTIVIFRTIEQNGQFVLWQRNPTPPPGKLSEPTGDDAIGWDLFRVPDALLAPSMRKSLTDDIEQILRDFGQQGDPTGVQPR
jgi:hypothetical protein